MIVIAVLVSAALAAAVVHLAGRARSRELEAQLAAREAELLRAREEAARGRAEQGAELARTREEHGQAQQAAFAQVQALQAQALRAESERAGLAARLDAERNASKEKLTAQESAREKLEASFAALSKQALDSSSAQLLQLTEQVLARAQEGSRAESDKRAQAVLELVRPVRESLEKVDSKIQQLEKSNQGAAAKLDEQVRALAESGERLRGETSKLSTALRAPAQRGRWGEHQLRRTIELAGLRPHVDFVEQPVMQTPDGILRPDVAVNLPGGRTILIDAKVPFEAWQRAVEGPESERETHLRAHAVQLRAHVDQLAKKQYWQAFQNTPEMIVLFLPVEGLLSSALDADPSLQEDAFKSRVVLATPTTLLPVLLTVAHVWKQESVALNAREIASHGRELHKRIAKLADHLARLGRALGSALGSYNDLIGSFEMRVLPGARKFEELQAAAVEVEIEALPPLEVRARLPQATDPEALDGAN